MHFPSECINTNWMRNKYFSIRVHKNFLGNMFPLSYKLLLASIIKQSIIWKRFILHKAIILYNFFFLGIFFSLRSKKGVVTKDDSNCKMHLRQTTFLKQLHEISSLWIIWSFFGSRYVYRARTLHLALVQYVPWKGFIFLIFFHISFDEKKVVCLVVQGV